MILRKCFYIVLFITFLLNYIACKRSTVADSEDEMCKEERCKKVANQILRNMDTSVNPCDNFYEYACGGWIKTHKIPRNKDEYSAIVELSDNDDKLLKSIMPKLNKNDSTTIRKVKDFYRSCLNLTQIDSLGAAPIQKFLKKIGSWEIDENWDGESWNFLKTLRLLHKEYPAEIFFTVDVDVDPKNRSSNIVTVSIVRMHPPDRPFVGIVMNTCSKMFTKTFQKNTLSDVLIPSKVAVEKSDYLHQQAYLNLTRPWVFPANFQRISEELLLRTSLDNCF